jgi:hypothetical protein
MKRAAVSSRSCGGESTGRSGPAGDDHYGVVVGNPVPAIARLFAADEDTVPGVVHTFNEKGLTALDP